MREARLAWREGRVCLLSWAWDCCLWKGAHKSQLTAIVTLGPGTGQGFLGVGGPEGHVQRGKGVMRIQLLSCFKETFLLLHALTVTTPAATYLGSNDQLTSLLSLQMIPARLAAVLLALALVLPGRYQRASISHSCPRAIWRDPFLGVSRCVWSSPVCLAPT